MQPRRYFLSTTAIALITATALTRPLWAQTAGQAEAFIRQVGTAMVQVVNGNQSSAEKAQAMSRIVDQNVDVSGIARFCLGPFWRQASPAQQREYMDLFHRVLVLNIDAKMGAYQGVSFDMGAATRAQGGEMVATVVKRPSQPDARVDWVVQDIGGSLKIVDVIAEGTSLRVTQRSDYSSFIVHNNESIQALLDAMKRQLSG